MTTEPELDIRRKRLKFRAWHRGMREVDLILGSFADQHVAGFNAAELSQFETVLAFEDPELYDWVTGKLRPPAEHIGSVMQLLLNFKYKAQ